MPRAKTDPLQLAARLPGAPRQRTTKDGKKISGTRLRKLVCSDDCGYPPLRVSRAAIDQGLPVCQCGATFWPWDLDDVYRAHAAGHLTDRQLADHPLEREYQHEVASFLQGQKGSKRKPASELSSPESTAYLRVAQAVHAGNTLARANAARREQTPEPIPF